MHEYTYHYSVLYNIWTVGYYSSSREWVALKDCETESEASQYMDDLNAGLVDETEL